MRSTRCLAILILASFVVLAPGPSQAGADEDGIRQAVLNYANSAYLVRPDLVEESVHPKLQKIGYIPNKDRNGYRELWMNFEELKDLVADWTRRPSPGWMPSGGSTSSIWPRSTARGRS